MSTTQAELVNITEDEDSSNFLESVKTSLQKMIFSEMLVEELSKASEPKFPIEMDYQMSKVFKREFEKTFQIDNYLNDDEKIEYIKNINILISTINQNNCYIENLERKDLFLQGLYIVALKFNENKIRNNTLDIISTIYCCCITSNANLKKIYIEVKKLIG